MKKNYVQNLGWWNVILYRWVFWILPGNPLTSPKIGEDLCVCGDHRPFSRRYRVLDGDSSIAPGEYLKNHIDCVSRGIC
ncbi:MAG: hypothetical protein GVY30_03215 [Chloroflexi bacterium]|nr:hypothetical protein [Chloroflexota bacterium]